MVYIVTNMNAIEERKLLMKEWKSLPSPKVSWERFKRMKQCVPLTLIGAAMENLKQKESAK